MQPLPCHDLGPVLSTIGNKFDLFPLLPSELRHEIWAFAWTASESTTSVGTVCALQSTDDPSEIPIIDPSLPPVYPLRNRALLATNKESRYIAHKLGTCRDFDPCIDILFIPSLAFEPFTFDFCENNPPAWVSTIRHLAIAPLVLKDGYESHLPHCLKYLNSLQKMSVVYPQSNGVVNSHADVKIPRQRGIALRLLSDNEVDELIVAADYTRMIMSLEGYEHICWRKLARQHIGFVAWQISVRTGSRRRWENLPPMWDHEERRLKLIYEARCFEKLD